MANWGYEFYLLVLKVCLSGLKDKIRIPALPCNILYVMHTSQGWTLNLKWGDKKSNNKELTRLFCNKFSALDFCTVVHHFFSLTCHTLKTWFELSGVKLYRNKLKENKNYFKLAGGSS